MAWAAGAAQGQGGCRLAWHSSVNAPASQPFRKISIQTFHRKSLIFGMYLPLLVL
jgi:hypothetical protein